jgi:hypothetical protein
VQLVLFLNPDYTSSMNQNRNSSLVDAVEQGRHGRGRHGTAEWSRIRALVLQELGRGLTRARVGGMLGLSTQRVTQLREEGCEAALRGGVPSIEAEHACASTWERWCQSRGDEEACKRVRHLTAA